MYQLSFHPYAASVVFLICLVAAIKFNNYIIALNEENDLGYKHKRPVQKINLPEKAIIIVLAIFMFLIFAVTAWAIYMHERNG